MRLLLAPLDFGYGYEYSDCPYGISHTGLHVSSINTAKVLHDNGIDVLIFPIKNIADLKNLIEKNNPTHVVLCAFWLSVDSVTELVTSYPYVTFAVNCHSNIAFLQSEAKAITAIRNLLDLEQTSYNFKLSGNSYEFVKSVKGSYESPCSYLPNLYYIDNPDRSYRGRYNGGTLRIGSFGALRPLKNPTVSAFAALEIARSIGTDLEFYVNVGRHDGWGTRVLNSVRAIMNNLPGVTLVEVPWQDWPSHRRLVKTMHLLLQPSFSETFNIVTADGASEGIPSVVTDAIEWAPRKWKGDPESTTDIAWIGRALLYDQQAGKEGVNALERNNETGLIAWKKFLGVS